MPELPDNVDSNSESYHSNCQSMQGYLDELFQIQNKVLETEQKARAKFEKRKKLLPRQRLKTLLDRGSDFIELCSLVGYQMDDDTDGSMAGGGIIAGIGTVAGKTCMIQINNAAIKGGTISPTGLRKTLRLQEIAKKQKLPVITLAESGGANLNYATDVFVSGAQAFANQARMSAAGLVQITVVHGNATAGGAYQPGLSDYVIVVRNQAKMFLAGPPLLRAATGEIATDEELGGAELHADIAGTADFIVENDEDGILKAREILAQLPDSGCHPLPADFLPPKRDQQELLGIVPIDAKTPYDVQEIIARITDDSQFTPFKPTFDVQTQCGFAHFGGIKVGIIGNNGPITAAGANKAAQFIQLCDQSRVALLFLHNTTGFMVGTESEQSGIIKHGSKMLQAVANARVPKISILVGGSYGAGNYAMCGRGLDPDFIFAWPNSRTAVMGGAQAGMVLRIVVEEKQRRAGIEPDEAQLTQIEEAARKQIEDGSTALFGTARLWDDGLIDPRHTRPLLIRLLQVCTRANHAQLHPNAFGVSRF